LHVLSTPPAFVLSQDQTLQQKTRELKPSNKQNVAKGIKRGKTLPQKNLALAYQ
jgi:hypothetical protein